MIQVIRSGKNPTMRYLHRTHRISVGWLHERFQQSQDLDMVYEASQRMCADIYTKTFDNKDKWKHACWLIGLVDPKEIQGLIKWMEELPAAPDTEHHGNNSLTPAEDAAPASAPPIVNPCGQSAAGGIVTRCPRRQVTSTPQLSQSGGYRGSNGVIPPSGNVDHFPTKPIMGRRWNLEQSDHDELYDLILR